MPSIEFDDCIIMKSKPFKIGAQMKRLHVFFFFLFIVTAAAAHPVFAATTLYVTSDGAELKTAASSSADTLAELKRGTELTLESQEGRWYRVSTRSNQSGWIYRGKVSEDKPEIEDIESDGAGLGGLLGGLSGSDINADAADSSRSIRGLSPEAREYAKSTGTPQQSQDALDFVTSLTVTEDEINQFLKQGKIGEYAE
jgi:uncharacterized protein YgiM (DUF1202 family)